MRVHEFFIFMSVIGTAVLSVITLLVLDQIWPELKKYWREDDGQPDHDLPLG